MKSLRFFSMHEQSSDFKTRLQADLALYGKDNGIEITAQHFDAITAWQEFMRVAIYGGQPDLTELGSTWLPDFAAMNVLRPFRLEEIKRMGGEKAFNAVLWRISKWGGRCLGYPLAGRFESGLLSARLVCQGGD